jgi:hypothetical protein
METKWVLLVLLVFVFGNFLASSIDNSIIDAAQLQSASNILSAEDIEATTPDDPTQEGLFAAGIRFLGILGGFFTALPAALLWDYSFLDQGVGPVFRAVLLYPISFMFSLMILGFIRSLIRL